MIDSPTVSLEGRITSEIASKQKKVHELEQEIATLKRLLIEAQRRGVGGREAVRSTSVGRILAEQAILNCLSANSPPESATDQLWIAVQRVGVERHATLRSHLGRMKDRGLITSPVKGRWRLLGTRAVEGTSVEVAKAFDAITNRVNSKKNTQE